MVTLWARCGCDGLVADAEDSRHVKIATGPASVIQFSSDDDRSEADQIAHKICGCVVEGKGDDDFMHLDPESKRRLEIRPTAYSNASTTTFRLSSEGVVSSDEDGGGTSEGEDEFSFPSGGEEHLSEWQMSAIGHLFHEQFSEAGIEQLRSPVLCPALSPIISTVDIQSSSATATSFLSPPNATTMVRDMSDLALPDLEADTGSCIYRIADGAVDEQRRQYCG